MPSVAGAVVTGCTEGGEADHGATCTWTAEETYTCSDIGAITCDDGVFSHTPSCNARHEDGLEIAGILSMYGEAGMGAGTGLHSAFLHYCIRVLPT